MSEKVKVKAKILINHIKKDVPEGGNKFKKLFFFFALIREIVFPCSVAEVYVYL